jgi:signal transduction histidine kinase
MSLSTLLAGARALLRLTHDGGRVPARAQQREPPRIGGTENRASPPPPRSTTFDVEPEIRSVLGEAAVATRTQRVRFEIAVQPELALRADRALFRQVLAGLVQQACSQALVGRVLVTASRSGEWIELSVSDDANGADRRTRQNALRPIERLLAQQGGSLELASWSDQGTTVLTHWPETGPMATGQGGVSLSYAKELRPADAGGNRLRGEQYNTGLSRPSCLRKQASM